MENKSDIDILWLKIAAQSNKSSNRVRLIGHQSQYSRKDQSESSAKHNETKPCPKSHYQRFARQIKMKKKITYHNREHISKTHVVTCISVSYSRFIIRPWRRFSRLFWSVKISYASFINPIQRGNHLLLSVIWM